MHRKLLAALVCACALTAVLVGPATASADTLTINDALGMPASQVNFKAESTHVNTSLGTITCNDGLTLQTEVTQNAADPVTLELLSGSTPSMGDCSASSTVSIEYSNFELTGPMELNADGTGTLPLRVTETWHRTSGSSSCVREGVLDLTYDPNDPTWVYFTGAVNVVSGSGCPLSSTWQGTFNTLTDEYGGPIDWVVTPPTLTLENSNGSPASFADFESPSTDITNDSQGYSYTCQDGLTLGTQITQNQADPVTLQLSTANINPSIGSCQSPVGAVTYSNIQFTAPMAFNADGTGTLALRVTETRHTIFGPATCVREGVLDLTYTPNQSTNQQVTYDGDLPRVSGSFPCPVDSHWQGAFDAPTENNNPINWVVTG